MGEERLMDFQEGIKDAFAIAVETSPEQLNALELAYVGDNVYETVNRRIAVSKGARQVEKLHRECSERASAKTQAKMAEILEPVLTGEENAVFHRGRNARVYTKAKNATVIEYHLATGLEALIGYLYLKGAYERVFQLLKKGWETLGLL